MNKWGIKYKKPPELLEELKLRRNPSLREKMAKRAEDQEKIRILEVVKLCKKCKQLKSFEEFYSKTSNRDGTRSECKVCWNGIVKNKYKLCPEIGRARAHQWRIKYPDRFKKWWRNNPDKINKYNETKRKNRLVNLVEINARRRKRYHEDAKHKEKIIESARRYMLKRRHKDINFRVLANIRSLINMVIKNKGNHRKYSKTLDLLGCDSVDQFRQYMSSQFTESMTWDNYGSIWHIDHIRPCASFNLSDPKQQLDCFNYRNCRPLFVKENLKKGSWYLGKRYTKTGGHDAENSG